MGKRRRIHGLAAGELDWEWEYNSLSWDEDKVLGKGDEKDLGRGYPILIIEKSIRNDSDFFVPVFLLLVRDLRHGLHVYYAQRGGFRGSGVSRGEARVRALDELLPLPYPLGRSNFTDAPAVPTAPMSAKHGKDP
jgi:hypothetical protein